jgi:ketosteroid isomerase-like protein/ribosomal protein L40E
MDNQKSFPQSHPSSLEDSDRELLHNPVVEDFFAGLKHDMRRPAPGQEAIAAALQSIQRVAANSDTEDALAAEAREESKDRAICASCGGDNPATNRFCAKCGVPLQQMAPRSESMKESAEDPISSAPKPASAAEPTAPGQHYYHHHYHHHYFSPANEALPIAGAGARAVQSSTVRDNRVRSPLGISSLNRAETAVRKMTQEWALACNNKQLDDLVDLYGADAVVLRPNVPAMRGAAAIREFFCAALDSGLGEVELQPLRVEVFGDVAYEAGRCKMLVPVAVSKRREERGKYLMIFARQGGDWKIIADCWSSDLSLAVSAEPASRSTEIRKVS